MNGMDFLKSCTTNVCGFEDAMGMQYTVFETARPETDPASLCTLIARIRSQGWLCSIVDDQIWVFGKLDSGFTELSGLQNALRKTQAGNSIAANPDALTTETRAIKDAFVEAIEGSIASSLSTLEGMIHLGPWQWLYLPVENDDASVLFQLHVEFTGNGALLLYTKAYLCCINPLIDISASQQVILAPSGRLVTLVTGNSGNYPLELQSGEPLGPSSDWKSTLESRLASEGIHIDAEERWAAIQYADDNCNGCLWWPQRLCFTYRTNHHLQRSSNPLGNWRQWFQATVPHDHREVLQRPLDFAEDWFLNVSQRVRAVDSAIENSLDTIAVSPLATSTPFNQRSADLQAAIFGIYPTPPDGLLPGPSLPTTTSDVLNDALQVMESSQLSDSVDLERTQIETTASSDEATGYQAHNDDLFGDIGGIEFGPNEVGDEDFDYFDEPDEVVNLIDNGEDNVNMASDILLSESHLEAQQHELPIPSPMHISSSTSSPGQSNEAPLDPTEECTSTNAGDSSPTFPPVPLQTQAFDPLSPFNIRERLLPPPIPASASQRPAKALKRSRTFAPMDFNEGMDFGGKSLYAQYNGSDTSGLLASQESPRHKMQGAGSPLVPSEQRVHSSLDVESSDEESARSVLDSSELQKEALPPALPWETKRKRDAMFFSESSPTRAQSGKRADEVDLRRPHDSLLRGYRHMFSQKSHSETSLRPQHLEASPISSFSDLSSTQSIATLTSIDALFQLTKIDLMAIAQIITEQAVSASTSIVKSIQLNKPFGTSCNRHLISNLRAQIDKCIRNTLLAPENYPIEKLLPPREGPTASISNPRAAIPAQNPQAAATTMQGLPAVFSIAAPYVRMQRGTEGLDVLPSALPFWQALGLAPASEPKNVEVVFMLPNGEGLPPAAESFMEDLRQAYEGCKLGAFSRVNVKGIQDGVLSVNITESESPELADVLKAYAAKCSQLGRSLAEAEKRQPDQTTVVCMVDVFEGDSLALQYLSACFWLLYQAYRDAAKPDLSLADIVLQIIPISLIAAPTEMVLLDAQQLATLAMEIYDRCPPPAKTIAGALESSTLPIFAAPALHLANFTLRRVGFQPTTEPPSDLLQEGSILHIAYALSKNEQWMTTCWIGGGGRSQRTMSLSLTGKSFGEVASRVWEQTLDIIAVRDVMWRVFLSTTSDIDASVKECWKKVVTSRPRKQMLHVTLISLDIDPPVQVTPATTPGGGFLTPASTPQAVAFTVSPDASGSTNAPLTPAPSDGMVGISENDPDAYLMNSADDSWGMLLSPEVAPSNRAPSLGSTTHGLLLRQGNSSDEPLETLGVDLHWDIRLRPSGFVDEGHSRQIESNLREALKLYRYLCLLTRIRGLQSCPSGNKAAIGQQTLIPVHALCAVEGAAALNGLMR